MKNEVTHWFVHVIFLIVMIILLLLAILNNKHLQMVRKVAYCKDQIPKNKYIKKAEELCERWYYE